VKRWHIEGFEGHRQTLNASASGRLSEGHIRQLLARLHCRHLSDAEIIDAIAMSKDRDGLDSMVSRNGGKRGGYMTAGDPHYTATYEDVDGLIN